MAKHFEDSRCTVEHLRNAGFVLVRHPGVPTILVRKDGHTVALWRPSLGTAHGSLTVVNPMYVSQLLH